MWWTDIDGAHVWEHKSPPVYQQYVTDWWNKGNADNSDTSFTHVQVYVGTDTSKQIPRLSPLSRKRAEGWISPLDVLTVWPCWRQEWKMLKSSLREKKNLLRTVPKWGCVLRNCFPKLFPSLSFVTFFFFFILKVQFVLQVFQLPKVKEKKMKSLINRNYRLIKMFNKLSQPLYI